MANKRAATKLFDIRYDVRLQARYVAEGKLSWDEVEKRCLAGPDAADNAQAVPAPEVSAPPGDTARPSRVRPAPGD